MKKRISDIIADYLADKGINDIFCLVGGGALRRAERTGVNIGLAFQRVFALLAEQTVVEHYGVVCCTLVY